MLGAAVFGIGLPEDSVIEYEPALKADDRMQFWGKNGAPLGGIWGPFFGSMLITVPVIGSVVVLGNLADIACAIKADYQLLGVTALADDAEPLHVEACRTQSTEGGSASSWFINDGHSGSPSRLGDGIVGARAVLVLCRPVGRRGRLRVARIGGGHFPVAAGHGWNRFASRAAVAAGRLRAMILTGAMSAMSEQIHADHAPDADDPEPVVAKPFHCSLLV
ncbi:MAG: hypothetical protein ABJB10_17250 [Mesorhizobium sp.]